MLAVRDSFNPRCESTYLHHVTWNLLSLLHRLDLNLRFLLRDSVVTSALSYRLVVSRSCMAPQRFKFLNAWMRSKCCCIGLGDARLDLNFEKLSFFRDEGFDGIRKRKKENSYRTAGIICID